jgi:hypothetical protein
VRLQIRSPQRYASVAGAHHIELTA